tara:strand:- start:321 stop:641 length:321 start_codon:yes stop_codon:yes gene_type:complete
MIYLLLFLTSIVIYFIYSFYQRIELRAVCKKLHDWKVYVNTNNCGFCLMQVEYLRENADFVNIVHCDDAKNVRECSNIQEMPQWVSSKKSLPGARLSIWSLKKLLS